MEDQDRRTKKKERFPMSNAFTALCQGMVVVVGLVPLFGGDLIVMVAASSVTITLALLTVAWSIREAVS